MEEEQKKPNEIFMGKIQKLSGWGYSYHERLLKLEGNILSYYKKVPKDFSEENPIDPPIKERKEAINIDEANCDVISAENKKKNKKLDFDKSFRVDFDSNALVGAKQSAKPKKMMWFFTASSKEERDLWIQRIDPPKQAPEENSGKDPVAPPVPPPAEEKKIPEPLKQEPLPPNIEEKPIEEAKKKEIPPEEKKQNEILEKNEAFVKELDHLKEEKKEIEATSPVSRNTLFRGTTKNP